MKFTKLGLFSWKYRDFSFDFFLNDSDLYHFLSHEATISLFYWKWKSLAEPPNSRHMRGMNHALCKPPTDPPCY